LADLPVASCADPRRWSGSCACSPSRSLSCWAPWWRA